LEARRPDRNAPGVRHQPGAPRADGRGLRLVPVETGGTVKAMLLTRQAKAGTRPLALRDVADPAPGPGEILVRVAACGVCRTDLHVIEGDLPPHRLPLVPGHQVVGRVEAAGLGASRFRAGDRVGIAWLRATC